MRKKQIIIISLVAVLVVALALLIIFLTKRPSSDTPIGGEQIEVYEPEFMTNTEKLRLDLPEDAEIQVLKRGDSGEIDVYKIIREPADVEYDLDRLNRPGI